MFNGYAVNQIYFPQNALADATMGMYKLIAVKYSCDSVQFQQKKYLICVNILKNKWLVQAPIAKHLIIFIIFPTKSRKGLEYNSSLFAFFFSYI